jgi:hypothetical protein
MWDLIVLNMFIRMARLQSELIRLQSNASLYEESNRIDNNTGGFSPTSQGLLLQVQVLVLLQTKVLSIVRRALLLLSTTFT